MLFDEHSITDVLLCIPFSKNCYLRCLFCIWLIQFLIIWRVLNDATLYCLFHSLWLQVPILLYNQQFPFKNETIDNFRAMWSVQERSHLHTQSHWFWLGTEWLFFLRFLRINWPECSKPFIKHSLCDVMWCDCKHKSDVCLKWENSSSTFHLSVWGCEWFQNEPFSFRC